MPSSAELSVVTMDDDEVFDCREGVCKSTEAPRLWPLGDVCDGELLRVLVDVALKQFSLTVRMRSLL